MCVCISISEVGDKLWDAARVKWISEKNGWLGCWKILVIKHTTRFTILCCKAEKRKSGKAEKWLEFVKEAGDVNCFLPLKENSLN